MKEQTFRELTEIYSATNVKKFRQSNYIPLFRGQSQLWGTDISEGMCRALSAAFIVRSWTRNFDF